MNKSMLQGLVIGVSVAVAAGAVAGYNALENRGSYAKVLSVEPVTKTVRTPHRNCWQESVTHQAPTRDPDQVAGTVVGAIVGGALGNQVGKGNGRTVATVAGAAAGGYAGNKIQERMQKGNTYQSSETRCSTTYETSHEPDGYLVRYELGDHEATVHMDHDPGKRIPVRDGKPVLTSSESDDA